MNQNFRQTFPSLLQILQLQILQTVENQCAVSMSSLAGPSEDLKETHVSNTEHSSAEGFLTNDTKQTSSGTTSLPTDYKESTSTSQLLTSSELSAALIDQNQDQLLKEIHLLRLQLRQKDLQFEFYKQDQNRALELEKTKTQGANMVFF